MSGESINQLVNQVVRGGPGSGRLQELLATQFRQTNENPYWTFYEFELKNGPFEGGEFRQSRAEGRALLSLMAREEPALTENDLDLSQWGEVRNINISPGIQPEGADACVYIIEGVQVSFQFTHTSRRLRMARPEGSRFRIEPNGSEQIKTRNP